MLSFADFGMGNGLLNAVARANGENDREAARKCVSAGFFVMAGIALLLALAFAGAYPWVSWSKLFNVTTELARRESGPAVLGLAACFLLNLPLGIVQRIQMGFQEGFVNDLWQSAGSLLSLVAVLVGVHLRWGLPLLILAVAGAPVTAALLNGTFLFGFSRSWLLPRWKAVQCATARALASTGFLFFLLQICAVAVFASDNLIVAQILGAAAVPQYALVQKVFLLPAVLQTALLAPLWPAYGEAIHRGDHAWVRRTIKQSLLTVSVATTLLSAALVILNRPLFTFWVGKGFIPSWSLILGFAVWAVVQAGGNAVAMYLNGSNCLVFELSVSAVFAVLSIPMKILSCKHFGIEGIVWASVIGYSLMIAVPYALRLPKLIAEQEKTVRGLPT
jgi:O-antigen/teichoic acid export membrane protein